MLDCANAIAGFEIQFAQAEREPSPLTTCKFTFIKIDKLFSVHTQPRMSGKLKNVQSGGLFSLK